MVQLILLIQYVAVGNYPHKRTLDLQLLAEFRAEENKAAQELEQKRHSISINQFSPESRRQLVGKKVHCTNGLKMKLLMFILCLMNLYFLPAVNVMSEHIR